MFPFSCAINPLFLPLDGAVAKWVRNALWWSVGRNSSFLLRDICWDFGYKSVCFFKLLLCSPFSRPTKIVAKKTGYDINDVIVIIFIVSLSKNIPRIYLFLKPGCTLCSDKKFPKIPLSYLLGNPYFILFHPKFFLFFSTTKTQTLFEVGV